MQRCTCDTERSLNVSFFTVITITVLVGALAFGVHIEQALVQVLEGFLCSLGNAIFLCVVDAVRVINGNAAGFEGTHVIIKSIPLIQYLWNKCHPHLNPTPKLCLLNKRCSI